jgi:recombination protein RecA
MASFKELTSAYHKEYGDTVGGEGFTYELMERIPTGIAAVDIALGGGLPSGCLIEAFGVESSCKSNIMAKAVGMYQKLHPEKKNAWFDVENTFDPVWTKKLGVDVDKLYVFKPSHTEAAIDMIEGLLASDECGMIVVDSLAAFVTRRDMENSAEKMDTGASSQAVKKLVNRGVHQMSEARKAGRFPTLVLINQVRHKIGAMGNPETTPGGFSPKFAASLRLRFYGKNEIDPAVNSQLPARKLVNMVVVKNKMPIVANQAEFNMAVIPHKKRKVGDTTDFATVYEYAVKHKFIVEDTSKSAKTWQFEGNVYATKTQLHDYLVGDVKKMQDLTAKICALEIKAVYQEAAEASKGDKK